MATINGLAERLRASDPADAHQQREIFERIRELRSAFDGPLDPESHRCLEAAGMLVAYLARMGAVAGEDVRTIAVRLLHCAADAEAAAAKAPAAESTSPGGRPTIRKITLPTSAPPPPPPTADGTPDPAVGEPKRSAIDLMGDMMLGQILLQRGKILEEHIHQAIKVQRATSMRIGDIFVKIGACARSAVAEALSHQASLRRVRENLSESVPKVSDTHRSGLKLVGEAMLGEILVERNVITRRQLERALEYQKQNDLRIGEALVKMGTTTIEQIEQALRIQGRERRFGNAPSGAAKGVEEKN